MSLSTVSDGTISSVPYIKLQEDYHESVSERFIISKFYPLPENPTTEQFIGLANDIRLILASITPNYTYHPFDLSIEL